MRAVDKLLHLGIPARQVAPPPEPNRPEFPYVGQMHYHGIPIMIEQMPGDVRSGVDESGAPWTTTMQCVYGEIAGTHTVDGDPVDVFVGEDFSAEVVYVISQDNDSGSYDEDKVMLGFPSRAAAEKMYNLHYNKQMRYQVQETTVADLKRLLAIGELGLGVPVPIEKAQKYKVPASAKANAQRVLDWKAKHGDDVKGMTPVGWARARQLATQDEIPVETVKRMSAFNRHRKNAKVAPEHKNEPWRDAGYVAWLGWGGDTGIDWARRASSALTKSRDVLSPAADALLDWAGVVETAAVSAALDFGVPLGHSDFDDVVTAAYAGLAKALESDNRELAPRLAYGYALHAAGGLGV